jgi:hypothetical protein
LAFKNQEKNDIDIQKPQNSIEKTRKKKRDERRDETEKELAFFVAVLPAVQKNRMAVFVEGEKKKRGTYVPWRWWVVGGAVCV